MIIKTITIKNFRSIINDTFDIGRINVIVGNNDAGKSNYLKALNLFFNNQTELDKSFDFETDYSKFTTSKKGKAKEIVVELVFVPPVTYNKGKPVLWRRVWRKDGPRDEDEIMRYADKTPIPGRAKVKAWLKSVKFKYVPAVKGSDYFASLLKDLHDTLSDTSEEVIKKAGQTFIDKIRSYTQNITSDLNTRLKIASQIQLPRDLSNLFTTLDFETKSKDKNISLNSRGDGIKARHIPVILYFLAAQGGGRINTIWGYEEPENNLEMSKAFELAKDFYEYSTKAQMLITTHSPAFYLLKKKYKSNVELFSVVINEESRDSKIYKASTKGADRKMGILEVIAPHVERAISKGQINKPVLFVEGPTDKKLIEKALKLFKSKLRNKIIVECNEEGGGYDWVKKQLIAKAYEGDGKRAAGLFDRDISSKKARGEIDKDKQCQAAATKRLIKAFLLIKPPHIASIFKKKIDITFSIEELFPMEIWKVAEKRKWLVPKNELSQINKCTVDKSFKDLCMEKGLTSDDMLYINAISDMKKRNFAKFVCALKKSEALTAFQNFKPLIKALEDFYLAK